MLLFLSTMNCPLTWCLKSSHDAGGKIVGEQRSLGGEISLAIKGHVTPKAPPPELKVVVEEGILISVHFCRSKDGGIRKLFKHGLLAQPLSLQPF